MDMMIPSRMWAEARKGSGRLLNPGKRYFLSIAADVVRAVALKRDKNGVLFTRKAMIRCGFALKLNGDWEVRQLKPELQKIKEKNRENFDRQPVTTNDDLEREDTESDIESERTKTLFHPEMTLISYLKKSAGDSKFEAM